MRALSALALVLLPAPMSLPVSQPMTPGDGLGAFSLSASAPAVQVRVAEPSTCFSSPAGTNGCEAVLPEAVSTLRNGPLGHGLAAVVWPGVIAAGAGSLLITAGGSQVPSQATLLNDPVKAEAYNTTGDHTVHDDAVPGSTMSATAYDDRAGATGSVQQSQVLPVGSFGRTTGTSSVRLDRSDKALATADSEVQDVTLAGLVTVAPVRSHAQAATDGKAATASGGTEVGAMTVAGIPVTVDARGVTAAGSTVPARDAQAVVNKAMAALGMSIALSPAQGRPAGAAVTYTASSLVVVWGAPGSTETVVLGGANVSVAAGTALRFGGGGGPSVAFPSAGSPPGGTPEGQPATSGSALAPGAPDDPVVADQSGPGALLRALGLDVPLPAMPWLAGIIGALATVGVAAGLKRLPDRVLARGPDADC